MSVCFDPGAVRAGLHRRRLQYQWGRFLETLCWSHFATFTFRDQASMARVRRDFHRAHRRLEQRVQTRVPWFWVAERGRLGARLHLHALFGNLANLPVETIAGVWDRGNALVVAYTPGRGAAHYVTRAIGTELVEYDICDLRYMRRSEVQVQGEIDNRSHPPRRGDRGVVSRG